MESTREVDDCLIDCLLVWLLLKVTELSAGGAEAPHKLAGRVERKSGGKMAGI